MNRLPVLVVGIGSILLLLGAVYVLFSTPAATTPYATQIMKAINATEPNPAEVIATWYTPLIPLTLGSTTVQASVASTPETRQQGLSDTPYLPTEIVKLFIFDTAEPWSIWMKDMNYPIDILWLDESKRVVHIEQGVAPDTYPTTFLPPVPALYVIETKNGYTAASNITVGTRAAW